MSGEMVGAADGVQTVFAKIDTTIESTLEKTRQLVAALQQAASTSVSAPSDGGGVFAASGGYIRGPGSSTSDSIPAWLSNGEFVINAAAVRHFGTSFFAALNRMKMPKFNMGGLVESLAAPFMISAPRFAAGGPVGGASSSGSPLTLVINGQRIGGLSASGDAVSALKKAAVSGQIFSAGRAPSWVR